MSYNAAFEDIRSCLFRTATEASCRFTLDPLPFLQMISAEAPVLFAKACEMFILELTLRSWIHTEENKRRTLQRNDIAAAITKTDIFDFLVDIVPRDDLKVTAYSFALTIFCPHLLQKAGWLLRIPLFC